MNNEKIKYQDKAIKSHHENAGLFADRYENLEKDPYHDAFIYGRKKIFELIFPLIKKEINSGSSVLDVGAGTGYPANRLAKIGYAVKAIEPAQGMRGQALKRYPELDIKDGQVTKLPFEDNSFELVTAIEVFRYLHEEDILKGYEECLRVLKPGGYFIITLVNRYALDGFIFYYWAKLLLEKIFRKEIVNYCDFTSPALIEKIFSKLGIDEVKTYGRLFSPLRIVYILNQGLGKWAAKKLEPFDNWIANKGWWKKHAGHLIVVVKK